MEVENLKISKRIVLCMNEFNLEKRYGYIRHVEHISELDENFKNRITQLSEKYNVSEKTIYSIIGYRYP